jgi:hypothetical protein
MFGYQAFPGGDASSWVTVPWMSLGPGRIEGRQRGQLGD